MDEEQKIVLKKWLLIAENDIKSAKSILALEPPITNNVCFHAQQCAEKCLKAFLVSKNYHIEKTHNLLKILKDCLQFDQDFGELYSNVKELTWYAIGTRYPNDWREIPFEEAQQAVEKSEEILVFVKDKLKKYL